MISSERVHGKCRFSKAKLHIYVTGAHILSFYLIVIG